MQDFGYKQLKILLFFVSIIHVYTAPKFFYFAFWDSIGTG